MQLPSILAQNAIGDSWEKDKINMSHKQNSSWSVELKI